MANVINSIINLIKYNDFSLSNYSKKYHDNNRANNMGRAFEEYMKDSFAGAIDDSNKDDRNNKINSVFSYTGNNTNPPDAMIKNGDAIEFKKMNTYSDLALNSSYPHHKLYVNDPALKEGCREAEDWSCKDLLYVVGKVSRDRSKTLNSIFMIYGRDYAADNQTYINIKERVKDGIDNIPGLHLHRTRELGRLNHVDELGFSDLRMRGMWILKNPTKAFSNIVPRDFYKDNKSSIIFIVDDNKWNTLENTSDLINLSHIIPTLTISNITLHNPNNYRDLRPGKLIKYYVN